MLKAEKNPGLDLITASMLTELRRKGFIVLIYILNAVTRLYNVPNRWKFESNKPPEIPTSYRPISLLPIMAKLFEIFFLGRVLVVMINANAIPDIQFGPRKSHSTVIGETFECEDFN